jgi:hypothetical protein
MPNNQFVVATENSDLFLIGYNANSPADSIFGNLRDAIIYPTLGEAQTAAASIGGGTVGTPKPH